ncbi:MAG: IPT/TIG domain-containing protein, partial [Cyanobacteria bacterium NC_groundwater_1444_Ag_S-0.65um_54_12]|nr:IPT/TIG domain-containing protein [Cyanobacteria bacterium NC_groundwater_1444_Ag_S-0.65um_54_12]
DLLNDFAKGATVSLIEVASGQTRGTSLADASGQFLIEFGSTFTPARPQPEATRSVAYYLEAIKGVKGTNPDLNQSGADAVRLRTLVWFDFGQSGWISLSNATPSALTISPATTAVAFFINQKQVNSEAVTPADFIGCLDPQLAPPNDYRAAGDLTVTLYQDLYTQIVNALLKDQDPIQTLVLSPTGTIVNTSTDLQVSGITPASAPIGSPVTIAGLNFEPANVAVAFVGALATVDLVASSKNTLKVTVPPGARSGLVRVSLNGVNTYSPPFTVTSEDGHRITFTDSNGSTVLYAVNNSLGTLVRVNPDGSTTTLNTALATPRAVLVNPEKATAAPYRIYVANAGTGQIVQLNDTGTLTSANWLAVTDPGALALGPDGDLYVAQTSANSILRARIDWAAGTVTSTSVATYTGLTGPTALAFDYQGYLYVVEPSANRVRRFLPQAGDAGVMNPAFTDWAYLNDPAAIALDTGGNALVTSPSNNVIFKIDPVRNMSALATVEGARSLGQDAAGNLYVVDQTRSLIRRLTSSGDQRIMAYGLANLRGLAVDPSANIYVALQNSGAILKLASDGVTTNPLTAGMAAPYGLTYRNGKIYVAQTDTQSATELTLAGDARSVITTGLHSPGGVEVSDDGNTYYVGRANLDDCYWCTVPTGGTAWLNAGIDIVTGGAITQRFARIFGNYGWSTYDQALYKIDPWTFVLADQRSRKLILMTNYVGVSGSTRISDVTPPFGGSKVFPNDIYDVVYDGSRYLYVSCANQKVYRVDTQNYGQEATAISGFTGTPYGLTMLSGVLYVVDRPGGLKRVSSPQIAVTADAWNAVFGSDLLGLTSYGGQLYVSDYGGNRIWQVDPAGPTSTVYVNLVSRPSRLRAYNDGRLLVRVNDSVFYRVSAGGSPTPTQYISTVGCTSCSKIEFFVDENNFEYWAEPRQHRIAYAIGMLNTRELARDGDWLYIAATSGVYGINFTSGDDLSISGVGGPRGLAVHPTSRDLYILSSIGRLYSVDLASRSITTRLTLGSNSGWGLDYDAGGNKLYAASPANSLVYRIDPTDWSQTYLKVGLNVPLF